MVCQQYRPPEGFVPADVFAKLNREGDGSLLRRGLGDGFDERVAVPFLACGDLRGWDSDQSYDLNDSAYLVLQPVQPPTAPPYLRAKQERRA